MDKDQFTIITSKLDSVIKLLALGTIQGKTLREQVSMLSALGFQPKQIADMLGKTPNHVSVILHELRKRRAEVSIENVQVGVDPGEGRSGG